MGKLVQSSTDISEHSAPGDQQQHPANTMFIKRTQMEQEICTPCEDYK
jgi:hypothetical protein